MSDKEELLHSVGTIGKRFSYVTIMMHEAIARAAGLSGTDHKYLSILIEEGPMTAGNLSKLSGLTTGAATSMIDRLEKQGLVKRQFVKSDRRKVIIVPDEQKIAKLLDPSFKVLRKRIVGLVQSLTSQERKIVEKYLLDSIKIMEVVTVQLQKNK